jgi:hypothetical protein
MITRLSDVACWEETIAALQSAEPHDVGLGFWAGIAATRQTRLLYPWFPDELAALPTGMSQVGVELRSSSSAGCLWRFLTS